MRSDQPNRRRGTAYIAENCKTIEIIDSDQFSFTDDEIPIYSNPEYSQHTLDSFANELTSILSQLLMGT